MNAIVRTYSMAATRNHPWENWIEPEPVSKHSRIKVGADGGAFLDTRKYARYFGFKVEVIQELTHYALIRRPDGLSCVVETADLEVGNVW